MAVVVVVAVVSGGRGGGYYHHHHHQAMDAISFIGLAMGADRFRNDAKEIMGIFLPALTTGALAADDVSEQNIMQALPRICEVLGSEFVPFLPALLPALLARADKRENWDALILQV